MLNALCYILRFQFLNLISTNQLQPLRIHFFLVPIFETSIGRLIITILATLSTLNTLNTMRTNLPYLPNILIRFNSLIPAGNHERSNTNDQGGKKQGALGPITIQYNNPGGQLDPFLSLPISVPAFHPTNPHDETQVLMAGYHINLIAQGPQYLVFGHTDFIFNFIDACLVDQVVQLAPVADDLMENKDYLLDPYLHVLQLAGQKDRSKDYHKPVVVDIAADVEELVCYLQRDCWDCVRNVQQLRNVYCELSISICQGQLQLRSNPVLRVLV